MEPQEESIESVIEEIATILAIGYLRLRKAQTLSTLSESAAASAPQATAGRLHSALDRSAHNTGV